MIKYVTGCFILYLYLLSSAVWADDSQPLYIEIGERSLQQEQTTDCCAYQVKWRIPATFKRDNIPTISLPDFCKDISLPRRRIATAHQQRLYRCENPLAGNPIDIRFPKYNPSTSTLIKYRALNGEQHTSLLSPSETQWTIPTAETASRVAKDYTMLGMQHIWAGTDHLLFLLCLLWIAGSLRRVLITITGFTLAHSLTLGLSALQWVRLPVPPVEAVIALSIVFLATEIVKDNKQTLTWRYPIAVSSSFGLLHGFGFAAALAEIGLPQVELMTGLLFFNVGVEIGQVVFACASLGLIYGLKNVGQRYSTSPVVADYQLEQKARLVTAYSIGAVASLWLVERSMGFFV